MPSLLVIAFLVAHGLIHASFLQPAPTPKSGAPIWPFDLTHSWLLSPAGVDAPMTRLIGIALLVIVIAGYAAAALAVAGIGSASLFVPGILAGSAASLLMLALFFDLWFLLGSAIDVALIGAVVMAGWRPGATAL